MHTDGANRRSSDANRSHSDTGPARSERGVSRIRSRTSQRRALMRKLYLLALLVMTDAVLGVVFTYWLSVLAHAGGSLA
jgi:hypothetical protein